jgi:hypothetical protein
LRQYRCDGASVAGRRPVGKSQNALPGAKLAHKSFSTRKYVFLLLYFEILPLACVQDHAQQKKSCFRASAQQRHMDIVAAKHDLSANVVYTEDAVVLIIIKSLHEYNAAAASTIRGVARAQSPPKDLPCIRKF